MKTPSKCFVLDLSTKERQIAYLCGFDEDKAVLKEPHLTYLRQIVLDAQLLSAIKISAHQNAVYRIWLLGTTSRTASFAYNLNLSRRRAQVVANTLNHAFKNLEGHQVPYVLDTEGMSETVALLRGRQDETSDHPLDRAVLLVAEWVTIPTPKPPVIQRPPPKMLPKNFWKEFRIRVKRRNSQSYGHILEADLLLWDVEVLDVDKHVSALYRLESQGGIQLGKSFGASGTDERNLDAPIPGPWHTFHAVFWMEATSFSGHARYFSGEGPTMPSLRGLNTPAPSYSIFEFAAKAPMIGRDFFDRNPHYSIKNFDPGTTVNSLSLVSISEFAGKMTLIP